VQYNTVTVFKTWFPEIRIFSVTAFVGSGNVGYKIFNIGKQKWGGGMQI
jgi:hypothetical protein